MHEHGFTGREAMGWLRVMRQGSIIGQQQRYLCEVERRRREPIRSALPLLPPQASAGDAKAAASWLPSAGDAEVAAGAKRRAAARLRDAGARRVLQPSAACVGG